MRTSKLPRPIPASNRSTILLDRARQGREQGLLLLSASQNGGNLEFRIDANTTLVTPAGVSTYLVDVNGVNSEYTAFTTSERGPAILTYVPKGRTMRLSICEWHSAETSQQALEQFTSPLHRLPEIYPVRKGASEGTPHPYGTAITH